MAAELRAQFDLSSVVGFRRQLELWAREQLPFATAAALTDTAKDAASFVRSGLSQSFQVRNQGLKNAIQWRPAEKRARPIRSVVGVAAWAPFLALHALGGVKRARHGRVAVPQPVVKRTASGRVRAADRPATLIARGRNVPALGRKSGLIAVRFRNRGVVVYHVLVPSARIRPRWPFLAEVQETVDARLPGNFAVRARQALASGRPGA